MSENSKPEYLNRTGQTCFEVCLNKDHMERGCSSCKGFSNFKSPDEAMEEQPREGERLTKEDCIAIYTAWVASGEKDVKDVLIHHAARRLYEIEGLEYPFGYGVDDQRNEEVNMDKILKKDIVIPAGTVLSRAPVKVERYGPDHYEAVIGLSDNTSGSFTYYLGDDKDAMDEYFEDA